MLILRLLFAAIVVLMLIPADKETGQGPTDQERTELDAMAALAAAGAALDDVRGFCDRQPGACEVGSDALRRLGDGARQGARALQDYLAEQHDPAGTLAPALRGRVSDGPASQNTLKPADLQPAWRGPIRDRAA